MIRPALGRAGAWLEARTGLPSAWRAVLDEPIPGGARWWYALGAVLTFLLALEAVTGVFLAFFYAPSAQTAWASTAFIQDQLTLGWFVRGLHSFGSSAMVIVSGLHFLQVVVAGAYRPPREVNWAVGLALFGLVLVFAITGYGLPWDQAGYWAKLVETTIVGTTPLVGQALAKVAQGGGAYGNYTVTHLFTVHALVLPMVTVALVGLHIRLARRHGPTPDWRLSDPELQARSEPYWPGQAFRDVTLSAVTLAIVAGFVLFQRGAGLEGPADPASAYQARPEWYARPLYQMRILMEGPLELVATMVLPGVALGVLASFPLLDRAPTRSPRERLPVLGLTFAGVAATLALGLWSQLRDLRDEGFRRHRKEVAAEARLARQLAARGVLPEGGLAVFRNDPAFAARELFREHCASCHSLTGEGGTEGPDLADYNSRAWIRAFLQDPQGPRFMGGVKRAGKGMKPVDGTDEELAALTELLYAQTGAADARPDLVKRGEALYPDKNCDACHEMDGTTDAKGPNLLGRGTVAYLRKLIADPSQPVMYGERAKMPKFAGKLTPEQIDALARFVVGLRR